MHETDAAIVMAGIAAFIGRVLVASDTTEQHAKGFANALKWLLYIGGGLWLISATVSYFRFHFFDSTLSTAWFHLWCFGQILLAVYLAGISSRYE